MLVLTRNVGEEICIDNNIKVKVLKISNGVVSIGIAAPKEISVDRSEVRARKLAHPDRPPVIRSLHGRNGNG